MFWKKNRKTNQFLQHQTSNRRNFFRLPLTDEHPVKIKFENGLVFNLKEIGAGGLSFISKLLKPGTYSNIIILLPKQRFQIKAVIEVIRIASPDLCCCRFSEIDNSDMETLHQYILTEQKKNFRRHKGLPAASNQSRDIEIRSEHD